MIASLTNSGLDTLPLKIWLHGPMSVDGKMIKHNHLEQDLLERTMDLVSSLARLSLSTLMESKMEHYSSTILQFQNYQRVGPSHISMEQSLRV